MTYFMTRNLLGLLKPPFFKPFPNFPNYKSNRNTLKYTVLFRGIIDDIMECNKKCYTDNGKDVMTSDWIRINSVIFSEKYYVKKMEEYNENNFVESLLEIGA